MRIGIDCRKIADFGIGRYIRGLLGGLAGVEGNESYVLFLPPRLRPLVPSPERFELLDLDAPHYSVRELIALGRAIAAADVDLLHAPHYVVPITKTPVVVTIHDLIHLQTRHPNPLAKPYATWMIGRAVRISRAILTPSAAVGREISARYPDAVSKIVVTPNGIDPAFLQPDGGGSSDANPAAGGRYFLYVGNDKPHKNLDRLVAAFRSVRARRRDLSLVLAGATPARFRSIEGVELRGRVSDSDLVALYRGALALVMPSLREGFGLPAAEALACGTAVIASDIAALREATGGDAMMIDPRSTESIADAMMRIASDPEERGRMIAAARGIGARLSWKRSAETTVDAYRSALESVS